MFSTAITNSDAFLDMPDSTQNLYFHLSMAADDDGFVSSPKTIMRMTRAKDDDLKLLIAKSFIFVFESGVIVFKHWRMNNYIRSDRYKPTNYKEELAQLYLKENGAYTLDSSKGVSMLELKNAIKEIDEPKTDDFEERQVVTLQEPEEATKGKFPSVQQQISAFTEDDELKETLEQFVKMRVKIRKNLTNYAFHLVILKLSKLASDTPTQIAILNQSITNSWQDIYALKVEYQKGNGFNKKEAKLPDWYEKYEKDLKDIKPTQEPLSEEERKKVVEEAKKFFNGGITE